MSAPSGMDEGKSAVESDSGPAGQGIWPPLLEALAGLDSEASQAVAQVMVLYCEFPA